MNDGTIDNSTAATDTSNISTVGTDTSNNSTAASDTSNNSPASLCNPQDTALDLHLSPHERRTPYNIIQLWKIFGFGVKQPQICTLALTLTKNC